MSRQKLTYIVLHMNAHAQFELMPDDTEAAAVSEFPGSYRLKAGSSDAYCLATHTMQARNSYLTVRAAQKEQNYTMHTASASVQSYHGRRRTSEMDTSRDELQLGPQRLELHSANTLGLQHTQEAPP